MLLDLKQETGGAQTFRSKIKQIRDDFEVYKKKTELELVTLKRKAEETQTELNNTESQFGDTQNSFNNNCNDDIEELRTKLSTLSIQLEDNRKEYRRLIQQNERELDGYYSSLGGDQGDEK